MYKKDKKKKGFSKCLYVWWSLRLVYDISSALVLLSEAEVRKNCEKDGKKKCCSVCGELQLL